MLDYELDFCKGQSGETLMTGTRKGGVTGVRKYSKMLYENKNLLRYSFHNLDKDRIIEVIEKAYEWIAALS